MLSNLLISWLRQSKTRQNKGQHPILQRTWNIKELNSTISKIYFCFSLERRGFSLFSSRLLLYFETSLIPLIRGFIPTLNRTLEGNKQWNLTNKMRPLILHNVPEEELYTGEDGIQRPYAMIFPEYVHTNKQTLSHNPSFSFFLFIFFFIVFGQSLRHSHSPPHKAPSTFIN